MEEKEWNTAFTEPIKMIDANQVGAKSSPWGNTYCYITEEQLDELKNGKVIYVDDGEYCHFIVLKKGDDNENN